MLRTIASAIVASAALLAAAGVQAQTANGYYVATPIAKPAKDRLMTRATPWRLQGASFVAAQAPERDQVLCTLVARNVGGLSAFTVGGKAYDAAQLDKCNGKAGVAVAATSSAAVAN
jgi:hypothetical protein